MITIVSRENTWHDQELLRAGKQKGVEIEITDLFDLEEKQLDQLGEVVLWRSSSLGTGTKKAAALKILREKGKLLVNSGVVDTPQIVFKSFQQEMMKNFLEDGEIFPIPTFVFRSKKELQVAVAEGKLSFPFIKKPDLGAKGERVSVISDSTQFAQLDEEEIIGFVFQNFIENKGDYRVFVVGGKPIGVMKRVAQKGSFLNNISQGGKALEEKNKAIREKLSLAAAKIAAFFDLSLCGIDFIFDEKEKQYYFLEINTVPQWQGFQGATKIDVASFIVDYCDGILSRKNHSAHLLIERNYQEAIIFSNEKKFHFYSRLFLWTKDKKYKKKLDGLKEYFVGGDEKEKQREKVKFLLGDLSEKLTKKAINNKKFREKVIRNDFPKLGIFHEILFRNLMAKNVFGIDLGEIILEQVSRQELLDLAEKILKRKKDFLLLSAFAVNYLYFLIFFLKDESFENKVRKTIREVIEDLEKKKGKKYDDKKLLKNDFYFLTHCIIGESQFYFQKIKKDKELYQKILKILETFVISNYLDLSLDSKLEFLVCCRLVGHETFLKKMIEEEAVNSFSEVGNFIIDKWNKNKTRTRGKDFFSSEHRNVLYILSQLKPNFN